ncbi:hypothetical protein LSAT2_019419 [Lamellibrachia satsuma]|nr:hypothetical protein LSAT2_019419 [Lamellibrachia satsuma]
MFGLLKTKSRSSTSVFSEADPTAFRLPALSAVPLATVASCDNLVVAGGGAVLRATTFPGHPDHTSQWRRRQLLPKLLPDISFNQRSGRREEEEPEWLTQRGMVNISQEVDRKIVTHLRKKLHRRLDRRLDGIITAEIEKRKAEEDAETAAQKEAEKRKEDDSLQLTLDTSKLDHMFDVRRHDSEVMHPEDEKADGVPSVEEDRNVNAPLIEAPEGSGTATPTESQDGSRPESSAKDEPIEEVEMDLAKGPEEDAGTEQLDVSPVPTPRLLRPETRDDSRLSLDEQVARMTCGDMDVKYKPLPKIIKIFVHAGTTDSEVETTALIERVYPQLKERCHQHGYELHLIDTTWGMRDLISDDHSIVTDVEALIDDCVSINKGINFITLTGQKYGEPLLPVVIPENEFDTIIKAITDEMLQQMAALEARNSLVDESAGSVVDDALSVGGSREGSRRRRPSIMFSLSNGGDAGPKRSFGGFQRAIAKLGKQAVAVKALMVVNYETLWLYGFLVSSTVAEIV